MDPAEKICRQKAEKAKCFLLDVWAKIQIERDKSKMQLFSFQ